MILHKNECSIKKTKLTFQNLLETNENLSSQLSEKQRTIEKFSKMFNPQVFIEATFHSNRKALRQSFFSSRLKFSMKNYGWN